MQKKEQILELLNMIKDDFPVARWLIALINLWKMSDELVDSLLQLFKEALENVKTKEGKKMISNAIKNLEKLKNMEANDSDNEELEELEKNLDF